MLQWRSLVAIVLILLAAPALRAATWRSYDATEIPDVYAVARVNDQDQVIGIVHSDSGPFIWDAKKGLVLLKTIGGTNEDVPYDLNNKGVIVGYTVVGHSGGQALTHACIWYLDPPDPRTKFRDLGTLPGGRMSFATAVNDAGQVVGASEIEKPGQRYGMQAFLWTPQTGMRALDPPIVNKMRATQANDINAHGQIAGTAWTASDLFPKDLAQRAYLWDTITGSYTDLGDLGGGIAEATGINDNGQIVGHSSTNLSGYSIELFIWHPANRQMKRLGKLGGNWVNTRCINNTGEIVGGADTNPNEDVDDVHAFLAQDGKGIVDLNTRVTEFLPVPLRGGMGINAKGQIAAMGKHWQEGRRCYLLTAGSPKPSLGDFAKNWREQSPKADLDKDGDVDTRDALKMLQNWLKPPL